MPNHVTTATVKNVELVRTGSWDSMRGKVKVTRQHLADAVAAARDPEVDAAAIKLGHIDPRFDGQPAMGYVQNLRLDRDGDSLRGDLVGVPFKLAQVLDAAYKRRSIEMNVTGVKTPSGKTYGAALTGLALLGVQAPAVKGLDDVLAMFAADGKLAHDGAGSVALELSGSLTGDTPPVPHTEPGTGQSATAGTLANGAASTEDQREEATVALIDELKAKLGLPADATEDDVQAALASASITQGTQPGQPADGGPQQQGAGEPAAPAGGEPAGAAPAAPAGQAAPADGAQPTQEPAPGTDGQANLSGQAPATVVLSAAAWEDTQTRLQTLEKRDRDARLDGVMSVALSAGKITPAEAPKWREALEASEEATTALLGAMQPRFATVELGGAHAPSQALDEDALDKLAEKAGL